MTADKLSKDQHEMLEFVGTLEGGIWHRFCGRYRVGPWKDERICAELEDLGLLEVIDEGSGMPGRAQAAAPIYRKRRQK